VELVLVRSQRACVRLTDTHLAVGDDRGRVIVVELAHGRVLRDLRLS
jgi:penicillin V acylase-like amidase (Ntn superfamily)